jgi:hypothetical protein
VNLDGDYEQELNDFNNDLEKIKKPIMPTTCWQFVIDIVDL